MYYIDQILDEIEETLDKNGSDVYVVNTCVETLQDLQKHDKDFLSLQHNLELAARLVVLLDHAIKLKNVLENS